MRKGASVTESIEVAELVRAKPKLGSSAPPRPDDREDRVVTAVLDPCADEIASALERDFPGLEILRGDVDDELGPQAAEVQILITRGATSDGRRISPDAIERMPRLVWTQALSTGYEHLEAALAERPDVLLSTARGVAASSVSEMVIFQLLALSRNARQHVRNQIDAVWDRSVEQTLLCGRAVGIVGFGAIGTRVAEVCQALGMVVYALARTRRTHPAVDRFFTRLELSAMAAEVDFLVLALPLTSETEKLVDRDLLSVMKPTAYVVNVSRGEVIDDQALLDALEGGLIAGAALDAFVTEGPDLPAQNPLWSREDVFATPHVAGRHTNWVNDMLQYVYPNMSAFLAGDLDKMINVVNRIEGQRV